MYIKGKPGMDDGCISLESLESFFEFPEGYAYVGT
jgi:hypothetical protein